MFRTNEYFDGNVKSIAFETPDGRATLGLWQKASMNSAHLQSRK